MGLIIPDAWKAGALSLVVVSIAGTIGTLLVMRANLKTELAEVRGRAALCASANAAWTAQNEALRSAQRLMEGEAKRRAEALRIAEARADSEAKKNERAAEALRRRAAGTGCDDLNSLLRHYREKYVE
jgi:hypothetical protein